MAIEKDIERNEANFYNNLSKYMIDKKNARMVVRPFSNINDQITLFINVKI